MSDAITFEASKRDLRSLWSGMERARKSMGEMESLRFGAWAVASGCAAATKVAPKFRKYQSVSRRKGSQLFKVTSIRRGTDFHVRAPSVAALKQDNRVIVHNRGLAQSAWYWAGHKTRAGRARINVKVMARQAARFGTVTIGGSRFQPWIEIHNSLSYAAPAIKGAESGVRGVVDRAGRRMHRLMNAKAAKVVK